MTPFFKKKTTKIVSAVVAIIIVLLVAVLFFYPLNRESDSYYMAHIEAIEFPQDVNVIASQVTETDVYGIHVLAEKVIETGLSIEEVCEIVKASPNGEHIGVYQLYDEPGYDILWDDYSDIVKSIKGKTKEGMNYYLLNEHTPYGSLHWDNE